MKSRPFEAKIHAISNTNQATPSCKDMLSTLTMVVTGRAGVGGEDLKRIPENSFWSLYRSTSAVFSLNFAQGAK
jgi:hypothetical protein